MKKLLSALSLLSLLAPPLLAAELQTEWIAPTAGATESAVGARIKSVEELPDGGGQRITIEIPRESMAESGDIQEIVVTAQQPDKTETPLSIRHEWVADYERDYYGLVLYLGKNEQLPLRIYRKSE